MGYMTAMSPCFGCKRIFSYNPEKVPSIRIKGEREPVCAACMERANAKRKEMGLEPHRIEPNAYGAAECA